MLFFPDVALLIKYFSKNKIFYVDYNILMQHLLVTPKPELKNIVPLVKPLISYPAFLDYLNNILLKERLGANEYIKEVLRQTIALASKPADRLNAIKQLEEMELQESTTRKDLRKLLRSKIISLLNSSNKSDNIAAIKLILSAGQGNPEVSELIQEIKNILSGGADETI